MYIKVKLKYYRTKNNLSMQQLQELSGVRTSIISNVENKVTYPSLVTLCRLAKALKITLEDLVDY